MGMTTSQPAHTVMPEVISIHGREVLLVHGKEGDKEFWWPPGAYWISERACDLAVEQPDAWIRRVLHSQIDLEPTETTLRSVEFVAPRHPPVMVYEVKLPHHPVPRAGSVFDKAEYFSIDSLPQNLGRDAEHAAWLKKLLCNLLGAA